MKILFCKLALPHRNHAMETVLDTKESTALPKVLDFLQLNSKHLNPKTYEAFLLLLFLK